MFLRSIVNLVRYVYMITIRGRCEIVALVASCGVVLTMLTIAVNMLQSLPISAFHYSVIFSDRIDLIEMLNLFSGPYLPPKASTMGAIASCNTAKPLSPQVTRRGIS